MEQSSGIDTEEMCLIIRMAKDILPDDIAVQIPPILPMRSALSPAGWTTLGNLSGHYRLRQPRAPMAGTGRPEGDCRGFEPEGTSLHISTIYRESMVPSPFGTPY